MAGRIIDADKLKAHYAWWKGGTREMTMDEAKSDFDTIIDLQPTVEPTASTCLGCNCPKMEKLEADPIKHGHWIPSDKGDCIYTCSECDFIRDAYILDEKAYCPHCGARMDAQIGEDKSHPFAESVMMGMDEVEE